MTSVTDQPGPNMRNPFRSRRLAQQYEACIRVASDNFGEFYYGDGRTPFGPRYPRTGAGHRVAFWDAYFERQSLSDGSRGGKDTLQYAAYRAGVAFRKGSRMLSIGPDDPAIGKKEGAGSHG